MSRHGKGACPAYTLSGRPKSCKRATTPAPGAYAPETCISNCKTRSPQYSMGQRTSQGKLAETPSPNKYLLMSTVGKTSPAHSMGVRHTIGSFSIDTRNTPAPGSYVANVDCTKKRTPAYSMGARAKTPKGIFRCLAYIHKVMIINLSLLWLMTSF